MLNFMFISATCDLRPIAFPNSIAVTTTIMFVTNRYIQNKNGRLKYLQAKQMNNNNAFEMVIHVYQVTVTNLTKMHIL